MMKMFKIIGIALNFNEKEEHLMNISMQYIVLKIKKMSVKKRCLRGCIGEKGQKHGFYGFLGVKGRYTPKGPKKA